LIGLGRDFFAPPTAQFLRDSPLNYSPKRRLCAVAYGANIDGITTVGTFFASFGSTQHEKELPDDHFP